MGNTIVCIRVDEEIWKDIPKGERSSMVRKFCRDYVYAQRGDLEGINQETLQTQITALRNKMAQNSSELQSKEVLLLDIKKNQEEKQMEQMQKEKDKMENLKKCLGCSRPINEEEKKTEFPLGFVCYDCKLGMTGDQFKKWTGKGVKK